jgi:hypothetical protein
MAKLVFVDANKVKGKRQCKIASFKDSDMLNFSFLIEFNIGLEENAKLSRLNERFLEEKMSELDRYGPLRKAFYFQTRARLHELLLLCAANYANNCEFKAVGDLMFNPRLTLVHVTGLRAPIVKARHAPLTAQFADKAETHGGVVEWLKKETTLETRKKPLIPHSLEVLEGSGFMSEDYLESARNREVKIADLITYLTCGGFQDRLSLENWMRSASQNDKDLMKSRFIKLDWETFWELGSSIRFLASEQASPGAVAPIEETVASKKFSQSAVVAF